MSGLGFQRNRGTLRSSMIGAAISCIFVFITQFLLLLVPLYVSYLPLLAQFLFSGVLLLFLAGFSKLCKRLLRLRTSAPAFVLFTMLFTWAVYLAAVRPAISIHQDLLLHAELVVLFIGFFRMLSSDPGFVKHGASYSDNNTTSPASQAEDLYPLVTGLCSTLSVEERVRFCKTCNEFVRGFDHHCPAFGNCIGKKNHVLFIVLLGGFIATEISYLSCAHQVTWNLRSHPDIGWEIKLKISLVISTLIFNLIQVLWQVLFLVWHLYCVCFNIKTDEWINWKRYPEFQVIYQLKTGELDMMFKNPYDMGLICNIKEFLTQN